MKGFFPFKSRQQRRAHERRGRKRLAVVFYLFAGTAMAATADQVLNDGCALQAVIGVESSGRLDAVNANGTAMGQTQITLNTAVALGAAVCTTSRQGACRVGSDAFGTAGVANRDRYATINPQFFQGLQVSSWQDILTGPDAAAAQQRMQQAYFSANVAQADRMGLLARYAGNSNNALGVEMNNAAMLQCVNSGVGNCRAILESGGTIDGNASHVRAAIERAGRNYNPEAGNCGQPSMDDGVRDPSRASQTNLGEGLYCSPDILSAIQSEGAREVDARMSLAANPNTGYSMLGGNSVLEAAGLGGSSSGGGVFGSGFRSMSCVDNLLGGLNILFQPPNFAAMLAALEGIVCNQIRGLVAQVMQPINQAIYQNLYQGLGGISSAAGGGQLGGLLSSSLNGMVSVGGNASGQYSVGMGGDTYGVNTSTGQYGALTPSAAGQMPVYGQSLMSFGGIR